jgi:single-stranded DNA-specific DHH superfamily exonuclease
MPVKTINLINDELTKKLTPFFDEAAAFLSDCLLQKKRILVYHHDDVDGIMSGLIMWKGLKKFCSEKKISFNVDFIQARNVVYRIEDALEDLNYYVVVIADMGSGADSSEAIQTLIDKGVEVLVIDHHPLKKVKKVLYVSSFFFNDSNSNSNYCAGYLCFEVVRRMADNEDLKFFAEIALEGDYSSFRKGIYGKEADVVYYLRSTSRYGKASLGNFEKTLKDKEKVLELSIEAKEKVESAYRKLSFNIKQGEVLQVVSAKFDLSGYPSRAVLANFVKDVYPVKKPTVFLFCSDNSINFRVNKQALDKGFKAFEIINKIKEEFKNPEISGGGHAAASGLMFPVGFENVLLRRVVELCVNFKG